MKRQYASIGELAPPHPAAVALDRSKGRFVVATRAIAAGAIVEEAPALCVSDATRRQLDDTALFQYSFVQPGDYDGDEPYPGHYVFGLATFCSHADEPKARMEWLARPDGVRARLVARRDIPLGHEITLHHTNDQDYNHDGWQA